MRAAGRLFGPDIGRRDNQLAGSCFVPPIRPAALPFRASRSLASHTGWPGRAWLGAGLARPSQAEPGHRKRQNEKLSPFVTSSAGRAPREPPSHALAELKDQM